MTLAARSAWADSDPAAEARRNSLYADGVQAAAAGRWQEAKDRFAAALALRASPKVYFSLAQAEEHLGQTASAYDALEHALEGAKAAGEADVVGAAQQELVALEPRVPHLRVRVSGSASATAMLDGRTIPLDAPAAVDPGRHQLVVTAPAMRAPPTLVVIGEGQQLEVPVQLEAEPSTPTAGAEGERTARGGPWRAIAVVTGAVGVVGLGLGVGFGLEAIGKNDESNTSGCVGDNCTPAAAAIRREALSWATASTVTFVLGALLAAGGVTIWLLAPSTPKTRSVGIAPTASPTGAGLALRGEW